jgi:ankyrin repeat protein
MAAVESNEIDFIKWLLSKSASINFGMKCVLRTGWTVMHTAARYKNLKLLKLLLDKGGDKNISASHYNLGKDMKVEDVTTDEETLKLLEQYDTRRGLHALVQRNILRKIRHFENATTNLPYVN